MPRSLSNTCCALGSTSPVLRFQPHTICSSRGVGLCSLLCSLYCEECTGIHSVKPRPGIWGMFLGDVSAQISSVTAFSAAPVQRKQEWLFLALSRVTWRFVKHSWLAWLRTSHRLVAGTAALGLPLWHPLHWGHLVFQRASETVLRSLWFLLVTVTCVRWSRFPFCFALEIQIHEFDPWFGKKKFRFSL